MDTLTPLTYGADCRDYTWYEAPIKTNRDIEDLKTFLHDMFDICITGSNLKDVAASVNDADDRMSSLFPSVDYGACRVTSFPYADKFRKVVCA